MYYSKLLKIFVLLFITLNTTPAFANRLDYPKYNPLFNVPNGLEVNVDFWIDIYSKYTTDNIVIHDEIYVDVIYEIVDIKKEFTSSNPSEPMKRRLIKKKKKKYIQLVKKITKSNINENKLNNYEKTLLKKLKSHYTKRKLRRAHKNIRAQVGQRNRFLEGLIRSGLHIDKMKAIFESFNLPVELTILPHVESSFNYKAYSRYGAAGIWQFTRSTGRRFMKIKYEIDERRDPVLSTVAAAKLLKNNYKAIDSWPLAITAYNHGLAGMKRGKKKFGNNLVKIIKNYKSRIFGFASKNFYAEFLAALHVVRNYKKYFGDIQIKKPLTYDILKLDHFLDISVLSKNFNITKSTIQELNPSLRSSILESNKYIPKGFNLKIPFGTYKKALTSYQLISSNRKLSTQKRTKWYKVKRGDTLGKISSRFKSTIARLKRLNLIRNSHKIFPGQILQIPLLKSHRLAKSTKRKKTNNQMVAKIDDSRINIKKIAADKKTKVRSTKKTHKKNLIKNKQLLVDTIIKPDFTPISTNTDKPVGWIEVAPDETLGHYGDWSKLPTSKLRRLNNINFREHIRIGQKIKISFEKISVEAFSIKRKEHHRSIEEDFFSNYTIENIISHTLKRGDTVWDICNDNEIPYWLLKGYNSDKDLSKLVAGTTLSLPVVSEIR